jgi:hypothetical protein
VYPRKRGAGHGTLVALLGASLPVASIASIGDRSSIPKPLDLPMSDSRRAPPLGSEPALVSLPEWSLRRTTRGLAHVWSPVSSIGEDAPPEAGSVVGSTVIEQGLTRIEIFTDGGLRVTDTCHVTPHAHKSNFGDTEIGTSHHVWGGKRPSGMLSPSRASHTNIRISPRWAPPCSVMDRLRGAALDSWTDRKGGARACLPCFGTLASL